MCIAGSGVIGSAIAWHAARSGFEVTLVDPEPLPGPTLAASWAAAGMLTPVSEAHYGEEELLAVQGPLKSGWLVQGPMVREFERKFEDFTDIKQRMKSWIDSELDHRMILRRDDPLVEALRTLRLIHYSAWIARRWDDPAFDDPTKPVGPFYSEEDARRLSRERGWVVDRVGSLRALTQPLPPRTASR